jgi:arylsulfatase A-like enzyme
MFTNAYSASTVCSSSRASLQTGKYPEKIGITDWIPGFVDKQKTKPISQPSILQALPHTETTLAEVFKSQGYKTFFAGKWHIGGHGFLPHEGQGYDINIGGTHSGHPASYYAPYKNSELIDGPKGELLTERLTQETLTFMAEQKDEPFFAFLSFYTVHTPITAITPYLKKYQDKAAKLETLTNTYIPERNNSRTRIRQDNPEFASMVHALDVSVGELLAGMGDLGLDKNTLIIFTSDNGGLSTKSKVGPTSNSPYRAGKGWVYEGGIRVPLIIKTPILETAKIVATPTVGIDIPATALEYAGISLTEMPDLDGLSLMPLIKSKSMLERDYIHVYYPHYHGSGSEPSYMVRKGKWKMIYFYENDEYELYNLDKDISESINLVGQHPELVLELNTYMQNWLHKTKSAQPKRKAMTL